MPAFCLICYLETLISCLYKLELMGRIYLVLHIVKSDIFEVIGKLREYAIEYRTMQTLYFTKKSIEHAIYFQIEISNVIHTKPIIWYVSRSKHIFEYHLFQQFHVLHLFNQNKYTLSWMYINLFGLQYESYHAKEVSPQAHHFFFSYTKNKIISFSISLSSMSIK